MSDQTEKFRIKTWPPVLLVRRKETNFLGLKKWKTTFGCGHKDLPLLCLEVNDTGLKIKALTNDMCPACFQLFIIQHSTMCVGCGDIIIPCGEAVGITDYIGALKKGLIPKELPPVLVENDMKYVAFHRGHHPGLFSGYWTEGGYGARNYDNRIRQAVLSSGEKTDIQN